MKDLTQLTLGTLAACLLVACLVAVFWITGILPRADHMPACLDHNSRAACDIFLAKP